MATSSTQSWIHHQWFEPYGSEHHYRSSLPSLEKKLRARCQWFLGSGFMRPCGWVLSSWVIILSSIVLFWASRTVLNSTQPRTALCRKVNVTISTQVVAWKVQLFPHEREDLLYNIEGYFAGNSQLCHVTHLEADVRRSINLCLPVNFACYFVAFGLNTASHRWQPNIFILHYLQTHWPTLIIMIGWLCIFCRSTSGTTLKQQLNWHHRL